MLPVKSFAVCLENWLELGMEHSCRALWEKADLKAQHWGGGGAYGWALGIEIGTALCSLWRAGIHSRRLRLEVLGGWVLLLPGSHQNQGSRHRTFSEASINSLIK